MKKLLVIGSAVADVIITLPHLPSRSEDVHVRTQQMRLGGCAYNTYDIVRHFGVPAIPFFPVGTGAYGDFVRKALKERGIESPVPEPDEDNGCCYCFVEDDGERTFLSYHGAEYKIRREWLDRLDDDGIDSVYICGLEIEEPTGEGIVSWLEVHPGLRVFFAPGPRLMKIKESLMTRILALHPILHMNRDEALTFTGETDLQKAAEALYMKTENSVLITLGSDGCFVLEAENTCCRHEVSRQECRNASDGTEKTPGQAFVCSHIPGVAAVQIDAIGAGDSHIGAVMSMMMKGACLRDAVRMANRISAKVVSIRGALLNDEEFAEAADTCE